MTKNFYIWVTVFVILILATATILFFSQPLPVVGGGGGTHPVDLVADISGILDIPNGGTNAATAADARTNLGVDVAGTDNSTDVTLAGAPDYITIAGQVITRNLLNLTTDVTGDLPVADGGTGSSTAAGARGNLGVDVAGTDNSTDVTLAGASDYITISGQVITRNLLNLTTDVTGDLPVADGGTGVSSLTNLIALTTHTTGNYVAAVTAGALIDVGATGEGVSQSVAVDLSELVDGTADVTSSDEIVYLDASVQKRKRFAEIGLSEFSNDLTGIGGLTDSDMWRLTSGFTGDSVLDANLERVDTFEFGKLGTGMSESTGVFTFPATGIWYVTFVLVVNRQDSDDGQFIANIQTTGNNGSAWNGTTSAYGLLHGAGSTTSLFTSTMIDVADTGQDKIRFSASSMQGTNNVSSSTSINRTYMTFTRLGDT